MMEYIMYQYIHTLHTLLLILLHLILILIKPNLILYSILYYLYVGITGNIFTSLNLTHIQILAMIISAAIHDVNHPGLTGNHIVYIIHSIRRMYITYVCIMYI